jgi:PilZ domain
MMLASVTIEGGLTHTVRVRNLSATGMGGVSDQPLQLGMHVKVELTELIFRTGRIVRTEGRSIGVAFDTPLDLSSLNIAPKSASAFEVSSLHKVSDTVRRPRIKP